MFSRQERLLRPKLKAVVCAGCRLMIELAPRSSARQTEMATLALAGGVAFLAGATDVYGLAVFHDPCVSFMSGNTTMLGVSRGSGDFARSALPVPLYSRKRHFCRHDRQRFHLSGVIAESSR
jgi:hypothetical protein